MICWFNSLLSNWGAAETIALIALGAAFWSANSSYQSAREAKRANEQLMYHERRAVFDAFLELSHHIQANGQRPELEALRRFYPYKHTAFFCFDTALVQKIEAYWNAAFGMADFAAYNKIPAQPSEELLKKYKLDVEEKSRSLLEEIKQAVREK